MLLVINAHIFFPEHLWCHCCLAGMRLQVSVHVKLNIYWMQKSNIH